MDEGTGKQSASNGALEEFEESYRVRPKRGIKSYDFRSAIGVAAEGAKGAMRPLREGYLIAPPCTSWHLPSSNKVPIGKQIFMDEGTGKQSALDGALMGFEESNRVRFQKGKHSFSY
jgi:hypothetical protein